MAPGAAPAVAGGHKHCHRAWAVPSLPLVSGLHSPLWHMLFWGLWEGTGLAEASLWDCNGLQKWKQFSTLPCWLRMQTALQSIHAFPAVEATQLIWEWRLVINHRVGSAGESGLDTSIRTLLALPGRVWDAVSVVRIWVLCQANRYNLVSQRWSAEKGALGSNPSLQTRLRVQISCMPLWGKSLVCGTTSSPQKSSWKNASEGLMPITLLVFLKTLLHVGTT